MSITNQTRPFTDGDCDRAIEYMRANRCSWSAAVRATWTEEVPGQVTEAHVGRALQYMRERGQGGVDAWNAALEATRPGKGGRA